ncbi:MAG: SHOCT domain-containing protein [Pseudomonadota bacterium]
MWNWEHHDMMGGMGLVWLLIAIVIAAVVWVSIGARYRRRRDEEETPEQVVKRRYANGEIDRETYEKTLEDLRR